MELVTVRVVLPFRDKQHDFQMRMVGEMLDVSPIRAQELIGLGYAEKPRGRKSDVVTESVTETLNEAE